MQADHSRDMTQRIRVNLRLWSDDTSISELLKRSNFEAEHCHRLGEVIVIDGRPTDRVARRHYAALQNLEASDPGALPRWLTDTQKKLESSDELSIGLKSGKIEGVVWIALFGNEVQPIPHVNMKTVGAYRDHDVKIMVENYTDLDVDGLPRKTWLAP